MPVLTQADIRALLDASNGPCVSIYLPTHRAGREVMQDPIRFKNLLRQAENELQAAGLRSPEVRERLAPFHERLNDTYFWQHQKDGLAVFALAGSHHLYQLPWWVPELCVVSNRCHLKPLVPALGGEHGFHVLTLSARRVTLYRSAGRELERMSPEGLNEEYLRLATEPEGARSRHHHSAGESSAFHSHGGGDEEKKVRLTEAFRWVDKELAAALADSEDPIILAGVDYLQSLYRSVAKQENLLPQGVGGNVDELSSGELFSRSKPVAAAFYANQQRQERERFHEAAPAGLASNHLETVLNAVSDGRVDTLFVAVGAPQVWGRFDPDTRQLSYAQSTDHTAYDLLDYAVMEAHRCGAALHTAAAGELPGGGDVAAIFRFA
jgi:hypothetical protein